MRNLNQALLIAVAMATAVGCSGETDFEYYSDRADMYMQLGHLQRAIQDYDKVIQLDPDYAWAYYGRGSAYYALGQGAKAKDDFDKACPLDSRYCR